MKIAVTAQGNELSSNVDPRFGRAAWFIVADTETSEHEAHENAQNVQAAQGAGIQSGQNVAQLGVEAVVTGNVGPKAHRVLSAAGIRICLCKPCTVEEAIQKFKDNELEEVDQANVEGHWM